MNFVFSYRTRFMNYKPYCLFLLLQVSLEDQILELVFEGITINSKVDHFTPSYCEATDNNPRVQLSASTSGAEYTLLYQEQLRNIIEGYQVTAGQETPIDSESTLKQLVKRRKTNKKNQRIFGSGPRSRSDARGSRHVPTGFQTWCLRELDRCPQYLKGW